MTQAIDIADLVKELHGPLTLVATRLADASAPLATSAVPVLGVPAAGVGLPLDGIPADPALLARDLGDKAAPVAQAVPLVAASIPALSGLVAR